MKQSIAALTLVVRDYDEAIHWYTGVLGFELLEDTAMDGGKRWVRIAPAGSTGTSLLLAAAKDASQEAAIGRQAGGRVFLFLATDDFERDHEAMRAQGVIFVREPKQAPYGKVAVFEDLYGNLWDLVQFAGGG